MKKFFEQETDYTCAIASILNVLSRFGNLEHNESEVASICNTTSDSGTTPKAIMNFLNSKGHATLFLENSSIEEIEKQKELGNEIILLISVDVPHCVVYNSNDGNHIFYDDPYFGENQSVRIKKFISENSNYPFPRWKTDIKSLDKYYPNMFNKSLYEQEGVKQCIVVIK